jgi:hypothetical protein
MELGELAGRAQRIMREESEAFEDIRMWHSPSECGRLVAILEARKIVLLLAGAGHTPESFERAVIRRTSPLWAYQAGLTGMESYRVLAQKETP